LAGRLSGWLVDCLADWLTVWLAGRLSGWLVDWLAGWPTVWLTGWHLHYFCLSSAIYLQPRTEI
jgi:hypothetical protein